MGSTGTLVFGSTPLSFFFSLLVLFLLSLDLSSGVLHRHTEISIAFSASFLKTAVNHAECEKKILRTLGLD